MSKNVKLSFSVTGDFDDLEVFANDNRVQVTNGKGEVNDSFSTTTLNLRFEISGDNGTAYTITYSCTSDRVKAEDPDNPSPVTGKVQTSGFKRQFIKIPL